MMRQTILRRVTVLLGTVALATTSLVWAAESLAPPHAPIIEGKPVVVVPHPKQAALLKSVLLGLEANKHLVYDMWRSVIAAGEVDKVEQYLAENFIEHNPLLPTGRVAFKNYIAQHNKPSTVSATIPELVTMVAEGPYVVMAFISHYPEPDNAAQTYTSTHFEMFRVEQGKVAEHWDSSLFRSGQTVPDYGANRALPVIGTAGLAQHAMLANNDPQLFVNKRLTFDLWRHIPEGGREEMAELYLDPTYIQHNPNAATGREGFKEYFKRRPDSAIEIFLEAPLVAVVAEGDLVVQVLQTDRTQNGQTFQVPWFDMFRIENGRAIEHWDTASKGELPAVMQQGLPLGQ